jgi:putative membrane-bound dehydrogenase-like protein
MSCVFGPAIFAAEFPTPTNSQVESIPFTTPAEALKLIELPKGFHATTFAAEPDIQQPIGITTDTRGRLWVSENYTYAERAVNFDDHLRDRIVILEDVDNDGHFDKRTVFWDKAKKLTSVFVGFGGVYALCPPQLLFIPDRDGDDVPDGEPEVLLDGWDDAAIRHNIVNGLKLGPDGWIYGRHGILSTSHVGKPGTPADQRTVVNCGIWRFHPVTRRFEMVAEGTTNPWGHDWDDRGQLFFINTVIGHLWHVIPGAYYKRMYGEHANARLYDLIDQTADHLHWDTKESWDDIRKLGVTLTTSRAGGGHAHSGLMIYQGENWPKEFRDGVFAINFHGRRMNHDWIDREGATFVAKHRPDMISFGDPWFRGIDVLQGPDGGVFVSDWSDIGECHDQDGVHRTSGRIYKITYGAEALKTPGDVSKMSNAELVAAQGSRNEWLSRAARQVLQERAAAGGNMADASKALRGKFDAALDTRKKLRALWSLHVIGREEEAWVRTLLKDSDEFMRSCVVQLLCESGRASAPAIAEFKRLAEKEKSGLVLANLASVARLLPDEPRLDILRKINAHAKFAHDPVLPKLIWYALEPAVPRNPGGALQIALLSPGENIRRFVARRLTEEMGVRPAVVDGLVQVLGGERPAIQRDLLGGMTDALRGWKKAAAPAGWEKISPRLLESSDAAVKDLARELSAVFGDGRASEQLKEIAANKKGEFAARRRALQTLVQSRAEGLVPLIRELLPETDMGAEAVRALAALGDPETPGILIGGYSTFRSGATKVEAINTLSSRPAFAKALLDAVEQKRIGKQDVGATAIRQLRSLNNGEISRRVDLLWPEMRQLSSEKQSLAAHYRALATPEKIAAANPSHGRELFNQTCAPCHTLYGEGGKIGPDLTGSDRKNLSYLIDNIVDPSAVVPQDYRVTTITLKDGRVINGIVVAKTPRMITAQTPSERLDLERSEIESMQESTMSMMPEGLLESLKESDVPDLMAYLMSTGQVPLK